MENMKPSCLWYEHSLVVMLLRLSSNRGLQGTSAHQAKAQWHFPYLSCIREVFPSEPDGESFSKLHSADWIGVLSQWNGLILATYINLVRAFSISVDVHICTCRFLFQLALLINCSCMLYWGPFITQSNPPVQQRSKSECKNECQFFHLN